MLGWLLLSQSSNLAFSNFPHERVCLTAFYHIFYFHCSTYYYQKLSNVLLVYAHVDFLSPVTRSLLLGGKNMPFHSLGAYNGPWHDTGIEDFRVD